MGKERGRKHRPAASRNVRRVQSRTSPTANDLHAEVQQLETTEEHEENFRPQVRVRVQPLPKGDSKWATAWLRAWGHLSDDDLADDFHDASDRERIRKGGPTAIPFPYWQNKDGVSAEPPFPDQRRDFTLRRTEAVPFLVSLARDEWLPLVWEVYAAAGLPCGALVYVQTPEREWIPEGDGPRPSGAACPAWRLPWAFRCEFTSEFRSPAYIAADLLQVAVALLEFIDPNFAKLRQRFAAPNDDDPLQPIDVAVLVHEGTWKFAALCRHAAWYRDPRGAAGDKSIERGIKHELANWGDLADWKRQLAPELRAAIEIGKLGSRADVVRRIRELRICGENDSQLFRDVGQMIRLGLLPEVRGKAGRPRTDD